MKYSITGYYGMKNYGDELFSLVAEAGFKSNGVNKILVISPPNSNHKNLNFSIPSVFSNVYSEKGLIGTIVRSLSVIYSVYKSRNLAFCGGSIISKPSLLRKIQLRTVKLFGGSILCIGVSVDDIQDEIYIKWLKKFISELVFLSVRDQRSYDFLNDIGVKNIVLASDLASLFPKYYNIPKLKVCSNMIGVSVCSKSGMLEEITKEIIKFCKLYNKEVKVFVLNTHPDNGDYKVSEKLILQLKNENINCSLYIKSTDVFNTWCEIGKCAGFISTRLHGAITAYMNNIPFFMDSYHVKCDGFLTEIGSNQNTKSNSSTSKLSEDIEQVFRGNINWKVPIDSFKEKGISNFDWDLK